MSTSNEVHVIHGKYLKSSYFPGNPLSKPPNGPVSNSFVDVNVELSTKPIFYRREVKKEPFPENSQPPFGNGMSTTEDRSKCDSTIYPSISESLKNKCYDRSIEVILNSETVSGQILDTSSEDPMTSRQGKSNIKIVEAYSMGNNSAEVMSQACPPVFVDCRPAFNSSRISLPVVTTTGTCISHMDDYYREGKKKIRKSSVSEATSLGINGSIDAIDVDSNGQHHNSLSSAFSTSNKFYQGTEQDASKSINDDPMEDLQHGCTMLDDLDNQRSWCVEDIWIQNEKRKTSNRQRIIFNARKNSLSSREQTGLSMASGIHHDNRHPYRLQESENRCSDAPLGSSDVMLCNGFYLDVKSEDNSPYTPISHQRPNWTRYVLETPSGALNEKLEEHHFYSKSTSHPSIVSSMNDLVVQKSTHEAPLFTEYSRHQGMLTCSSKNGHDSFLTYNSFNNQRASSPLQKCSCCTPTNLSLAKRPYLSGKPSENKIEGVTNAQQLDDVKMDPHAYYDSFQFPSARGLQLQGPGQNPVDHVINLNERFLRNLEEESFDSQYFNFSYGRVTGESNENMSTEASEGLLARNRRKSLLTASPPVQFRNIGSTTILGSPQARIIRLNNGNNIYRTRGTEVLSILGYASSATTAPVQEPKCNSASSVTLSTHLKGYRNLNSPEELLAAEEEVAKEDYTCLLKRPSDNSQSKILSPISNDAVKSNNTDIDHVNFNIEGKGSLEMAQRIAGLKTATEYSSFQETNKTIGGDESPQQKYTSENGYANKLEERGNKICPSTSTICKSDSGHKQNNLETPEKEQENKEEEKESNANKSIVCSVCNKAFNRSSNLYTHMRTHSTNKPHGCEFCGKRFHQKADLRIHRYIHTGEKPHKCTKCGRGFKQLTHLKYHMRTHSDVRMYKCQYCDKGFNQKSNLQAHIFGHTGQRPHKCDVCGKGFTLASTLNTHKRTHLARKPFKCDYCDKAFYQKNALKMHYVSTHPYSSGVCML